MQEKTLEFENGLGVQITEEGGMFKLTLLKGGQTHRDPSIGFSKGNLTCKEKEDVEHIVALVRSTFVLPNH